VVERRRNSEIIAAWLALHQVEVDALTYGKIEFVFTNGIHPRVTVQRSEQLDCTPSVVPGMD
jgi:hypothetical protein